MNDTDLLQLKTSLIQMGVPVFKNNKICKRDLKDLRFKESGLLVSDIKLIDKQDDVNKMTCTWHLAIDGGKSDNIMDVFKRNKGCVEKKLLWYIHKMGFCAVNQVELNLKNLNDKNVWIEVTHHYDLKEAYEKEEGCIESFFHRLFERG